MEAKNEENEPFVDTLLKTIPPEQLHLFRTFRLIYPEATETDWCSFRDQPLHTALSQVVDSLPIATILVICRRHPEELAYFLSFFDSSARMVDNPRQYLPFVFENIKRIPIQWIVHHVMQIKDVRYAYQLATVVFANAVTVDRCQLEIIREQEKTWQEFKQISKCTKEMSHYEGWSLFIDIRVAMRELIDFKLGLNLTHYAERRKDDFVKKLLVNCGNMLKYEALLQSSLVRFCGSHKISITNVVIATVPRKEWPVAHKLLIISEFVDGEEAMKRALGALTYRSDAELNQIREFAAQGGIEYCPDPNNFVVTASGTREARRSLNRCTSFEIMESHDVRRSVKIGLDMWKKSPSTANLAKQVGLLADSMPGLANGDPPDVPGYIEKLKKYKCLSDIRPIFELAEKFGMVVKLEDFRESGYKSKILVNSIRNGKVADFGNLCDVMDMTVDEIAVGLLADFDDIKDAGEEVLTYLAPKVSRTSATVFSDLMGKIIEYLKEKLPIEKVCNLWAKCLLDTLDAIDGLKMMFTIDTVRVLNAIRDMSAPDENKRELLYSFMANDDLQNVADEMKKHGQDEIAQSLTRSTPSGISKKEFQQLIICENGDDIVKALTEIPLLDKDTAIDFIKGAIEKLDGMKHGRLICLYSLLEERGVSSQRELTVLNILQTSPDLVIDFHEVMETPLQTLCRVLTLSNVWNLVSLGGILEVESDLILTHLILNVMTSKVFEDYRPFISRLTVKDTPELMKELPPKLKPDERPKFYKYIGYVDLMLREQTINDLQSLGLSEFTDTENLQKPRELICALYSNSQLQEMLGKRLHELTKAIADRYEIRINDVRRSLVKKWLNALEVREAKEANSVYVETLEELIQRDENANIQNSLFILRAWKMKTSVRFLLKFILSQGPTDYRAKAKAFSCLFSVGDEKTIAKAFAGTFEELHKLHKEMWYRSRLILFNEQLKVQTLTKESVEKVVRVFMMRKTEILAGVFPTLFELCLDFEINDKDLLLEIIAELEVKRKRFLMNHIGRMFRVFPEYRRDQQMQDKFILALSAPIDELVAKRPEGRPTGHHQSIIHELFNILATKPVVMNHWFIQGQRLSWRETISRMVHAGFASWGAEIGSFVVEQDIRQQVLNELLSLNVFDSVLMYGFQTDKIFEFLREKCIEPATKLLDDDHFLMFQNWLLERCDYKSSEMIYDALVKQRRVKEAERLMERIRQKQASHRLAQTL